MNPQLVLAILQLATVLTPPAIQLANNLMNTMEKSDESPEEKIKKINDLLDKLQPMQPKL